jgi:hypothetical protein
MLMHVVVMVAPRTLIQAAGPVIGAEAAAAAPDTHRCITTAVVMIHHIMVPLQTVGLVEHLSLEAVEAVVLALMEISREEPRVVL